MFKYPTSHSLNHVAALRCEVLLIINTFQVVVIFLALMFHKVV